MSTMSNRSILRFPTEVFHLIFDYLDARTIVISFGLVSQEMHEIVNSYNRLKINFSTLSDSHLRSLSELIQPQNVIAISLSNPDYVIDRSYQDNFLLSLFKFNEFIRLKSLKLVRIDGEQFDHLFEHIYKHSLKSLSITIPYQKADEIHRIIEFSSSTILPYGLKHMDLYLNENALINIDIFEPVKHVLRSLKIKNCTHEEYHRILSSCVNLKTLLIHNYDWEEKFLTVLSPFGDLNYVQLRSLTINSHSLTFKQLCSILSLTPLLVHLQINLRNLESDCNFNGNDWEEFLRNKLNHLKNFQFLFIYRINDIDYCRSLSSIIEPFKTPFWLTEKRWIVVCDFDFQFYDISLYTLPVSIYHTKLFVRCSALSLNDDCYLLSGRTGTYSNCISPKQNFPVVILSILRIHLTDTGARFLAKALETNTTLTTFTCDDHSMSIEGICYIANALAKNQTLAYFTLQRPRTRFGKSLPMINPRRRRRRDSTDMFEEERFTSSIYSHDTRGDQYAECIANALIINKTLQVLSLESNQITDRGAKHLAEALKKNSTLFALNCGDNEIGDDGLDYLTDALLVNTSLKQLYLSQNSITSSGIEYLSNVLQMNQTLTELFLGSNQIDSFGCQYLANMLLNNQTLHTLMLENNAIEDQGAEYLAQALVFNTTLQTLNLRKNNIRIPGAEHLVKALDKNRTLVSLHLQGNRSIDGTTILELINQLIGRNKELLKK